MILLSFFAFAIVYFPTKEIRIGISPDSIHYIGTARNLIAGDGFNSYNNSPLLLYPPFYPLLLAFFGLIFKTDPLVLANTINSVLFGLITFSTGVIAFSLTRKSIVFAFLASLTVVFSIPLYGVTTMAWSETLFIFFVIMFFLIFKIYSESHKIIYLLYLICVTAFACITRYIGVVLIFVGIIGILMISDHIKKFSHILFFTVFSSLPLCIWLLKNVLISGTFTGIRQLSDYTLFDNVLSLLKHIFSWFFPDQLKSNRILLIAIGLLLGILIGYYIWYFISKKKAISPIQFILIIFTFGYIVFLLISSKSAFSQLIDNRFLSPVFIPIILLIFIIADDVVIIMQEHHSLKKISPVIIFFLTMSIFYSGKTTLNNSNNLSLYRLGFNTKSYLQSNTLEYLLNHPSALNNCKIYTNNPIAISFIAYIPAETSPSRKANYLSSIVADDIMKLDGSWITQKSCLIWFQSDSVKDLYSLYDLQEIVNLELINSFSDGAIYTIDKK